jgi:hypothetical protein
MTIAQVSHGHKSQLLRGSADATLRFASAPAQLAQILLIVLAEVGADEEFWSALKSAAQRFATPPKGNLCMMAGQQNLRHFAAAVLGRPRVVWVLKKALGVRVLLSGCGIAQYAWEQARHRINHDHGRDLPARKHVVADGDYVGIQ